MSNEEHVSQHGKSLHVHRVIAGSEYVVSDGCVTLCYKCHGKKPKARQIKGPCRALTVWLPEKLRNQFDLLVLQHRRPLTVEVEIALEEYLSKHGLWPPGGD